MMSAHHPAFDPASAHPAAQWLTAANIRELTADSRAVTPAHAFIAYAGVQTDGRKFISDAVARGAPAVLWDPADNFIIDCAVPNLAVPGLKQHISRIAGDVFGRPSSAMWMTGVTGTNGKTSTSTWIAESLGDCGQRAGLIGTLGTGFPVNWWKAATPRRTPSSCNARCVTFMRLALPPARWKCPAMASTSIVSKV